MGWVPGMWWWGGDLGPPPSLGYLDASSVCSDLTSSSPSLFTFFSIFFSLQCECHANRKKDLPSVLVLIKKQPVRCHGYCTYSLLLCPYSSWGYKEWTFYFPHLHHRSPCLMDDGIFNPPTRAFGTVCFTQSINFLGFTDLVLLMASTDNHNPFTQLPPLSSSSSLITFLLTFPLHLPLLHLSFPFLLFLYLLLCLPPS